MAETKVINLEVKDNSEKAAKGFKNLNKEIKNTESSVKDTEEASKELGSATDSITGGMLGKFKGLYTSVQTVVRGMNFLKLAIIGTGLGALLIAIVSIKQAFTSSEEGQNKFAKYLVL
jgi:tetrahydromethanopterin S-methyltransferase subunit A